MHLFKPTVAKRALFFVTADFFISCFTLYFAYLLRFNFNIPKEHFSNFPKVFLVLVCLKILFFFLFKVYFFAWRFFALNEAKKLLYAHIFAYLVFAILFNTFRDFFNPMPRSAILIDFFMSLFFIGGLRISKRLYLESFKKEKLKPTLVIGATPKASAIIKNFISDETEYWPTAIIDDNPSIINTYFSNLKVYPMAAIEDLINKLHIKSVIIAKDMDSKELDRLFEKLKNLDVEDIKIAKLLGDRVEELKDISIEDLLARKPKDLDTEAIKNFIENKTVLITGAGGSIGSEIARQCRKFGARKLILLDNAEYNLYSITEELSDFDMVPVMQSVTDKEAIEKTLAKFRPDIVVHAAAYKHVPLVEFNPKAAVINNILGTKNVIDAAIENGVKKFVLISTDKAVRPTNIMGATKRVCELYAQNVDSKETEIVSVRFGNVLGSSGSVIPKFKEQIKNGGPLTVTHPEVTRYFMLIPEACQLVLQAAAIAKGGEIFILDMGEPVKIVDLAKKMLKLYGKENEIEIEFTGLRPGEKLFEELLLDETEQKTKYDSIYVTKPTVYDIERLNKDIEALLNVPEEEIVNKLKNIVKEFNHNVN